MIPGREEPIKKGPKGFEEPGVDKAWYTPEFQFDDRFIPWDYKLWGATPPLEVVEVPVVAVHPPVLPVRGPVLQQRLPQRPIVIRP